MSKTFLLIDADADGRDLIIGTLLRVFSDGAVTECQEGEMALKLVREYAYDAVILHRAIGVDSESLLRTIRSEQPDLPLLTLSESNRRKDLLAAGATKFLNYEAWLMVGKTVAEMISSNSKTPFAPTTLPLTATTGLVG